MSVILGLVFVLILVVGYKYRNLFSRFHHNSMYESALHRIEQSSQQSTMKKKCPRCNSDMIEGHVMIRYLSMNQDLAFLLQSNDLFRLATDTMESKVTRIPFTRDVMNRRGYRCPVCGIVGIDS